MDISNKSKTEQLSEISFKYLKNKALSWEQFRSGLLENEESYPKNTALYYKAADNTFHRSFITGGRRDEALDGNFTFLGFTSVHGEIDGISFLKDSYGESWFVVVSDS